jgi:outer membrane protein
MRKTLLIGVLTTVTAAAQLPPPPPRFPEPVPGKPAPFDPNTIREALPLDPIILPGRETPAAPTAPLRPEQAVELALQLQPDVRVARGRLLSAEGSTQVQRSRLLPNIGGTSSYERTSVAGPGNTTIGTGTGTGTGTAPGTPSGNIRTQDRLSNSLGISQLLFDFGHTRDLVREADLRRQAAAALVLVTENDVALLVKERFYTALQTRRLVVVAEGDVANRREQLRLARALYQAGGISPGDVVRAQTTVSNAVFGLNNARRNMETARQDLAQAMGLPPLTPLTLVDVAEPDLPEKDIDRLTASAAERRPDLLVAERNVAASLAGLDAARTTNYPALSTFAGITYSGLTNGVQYPSFNLQLALDFNLYDGGQRAGATKIAEGTLEGDRAELTRTQLAVEREVTGVYMELLTAERNVDAAGAAVDSARQGVRIAFGRYQAALGTLTDVLDTQNQLVAAQTNYANALLQLDLARSRMRHALAAPLEEGYFSQEPGTLQSPGAEFPRGVPLPVAVPSSGPTAAPAAPAEATPNATPGLPAPPPGWTTSPNPRR